MMKSSSSRAPIKPPFVVAASMIVGLCAGILALTFGATATAQTEAPGLPEAESIRSRMDAVRADTGLPEEIKERALQYYDRAVAALDDRDRKTAEFDELNAIIASAPTRIPSLRDRLSEPPTEEKGDIPLETSPDALQALVAAQQADLIAARDNLKDREKDHRETLVGGEDFSARLVESERRLQVAEMDLQAPPIAGEPETVGDARRTYLAALNAYQRAEIAFLRTGLSNFELLVDLTTLERDAAMADVKLMEAELEQLEGLFQVQRAQSARQATEQAETVSAMSTLLPPPVATIAEENARLRAELEEITLEENDVTTRLRTTEQQLGNLEADLAATRRRVEVTGGTEAIGRLLRRRLERLPSARDYRRAADKRRKEISRVTDRRIDVDEQRSDLSDLDARNEALITELGPDVGRFDEDYVRQQARELLSAQRQTLTELYQQYRRLGTQLVALDVGERQLVASVDESTDFIRQALFRIRSLPVLTLDDFAQLPTVWRWLASPQAWSQVLQDAAAEYFEHPLWSSLAILAFLAGLYLRLRIPTKLTALAKPVRQIRTDSIVYTLKAVTYAVIAASVWPLALVFVGWHVLADPIGTSFNLSVGWGLMWAAAWLWLISYIRWLYHPDGVLTGHLRRPKSVAKQARKELRWLSFVLVPGAFLVMAADRSGDVHYVLALGRPAFIVMMLGLSQHFWHASKRSDSFSRQMDQKANEHYRARTRPFAMMLLISAPLALAIASVFGYHYTASSLAELFVLSLFYLIGLVLLNEVLVRWLYVSERRLRLESALRQREEARAEREKGGSDVGDFFEIDVPELDYKSLGAQGRAMVRGTVLVAAIISLGTLWGELFPAVSILNEIHLPFSRVETIDGVSEQVPVNLADLTIALLILGGTLFAAKNLSGLLEFTVLRRWKIDTGGRYAIVTLCQYVVVAFGVIASFSAIGWEWSNLQWLVAALGVGLGFGLQEIVANFVSGIILLLERPIRIGDTVTLGDQGGVVARIQIRATTILTWEKKELLVPNKEFITGRVLNWTLTGELTRVLINIGIAYGADVNKAMALVLEAAKENENVVDDPAPIVTFEAFGDNSLGLFLRAFCDSLDNRLSTITELHRAIYDKLNAAGIPIAFPQRDVHLDTAKPLEIKVLRGEPGGSRA